MPQVLRSDNIPSTFTITGALTAQMVASVSSPIRATIGGQQYTSTSNLSLNLATTGAGGLDTGSAAIGTYYLYLVVSGGALALVASLSTAPSGFSVHKQIGRVIVGSGVISTVSILDIKSESDYESDAAKVKSNYLLNGGFYFWDRGNTFTTGTAGIYGPDRFVIQGAGNSTGGTWTRDADVPSVLSSVGVPYSIKVVKSSTSASSHGVHQKIESYIAKTLVGKKVTFSFYHKGNYVSGSVLVCTPSGAGNDNWLNSRPTTENVSHVQSFAISNSWTRVSFTFEVTSTMSSGFSVGVDFGGSTSGQIAFTTGWMLETGSIATDFISFHVDRNDEYLGCKRYYQAQGVGGVSGRIYGICGASATTGRIGFPVRFVTPMRTSPTITFYDATDAPNVVTAVTSTGGAQVHGEGALQLDTSSTGFTGGRSNGGTAAFGVIFGYTADAEL